MSLEIKFRIDAANWALDGGMEECFRLLELLDHNDKFLHLFEFRWTLKARCDENWPVLHRGHVNTILFFDAIVYQYIVKVVD